MSFLSIVQSGLQDMGFTLATNESSLVTSLNVTTFDDNAALDKLIEGWRALDPDFVACKLLVKGSTGGHIAHLLLLDSHICLSF